MHALSPSKWFAEQVQPHEGHLRNYLHGAFPKIHDIDDIVQESYLRIWKAKAGHEILSVRAFLFRIARNLAMDLVRRRRRSPVDGVGDFAELSVVEDRPIASEVLSLDEKFNILAEAVADLPPRCRELIVLCKIKGLTHREAAEHLGLSIKTVDEHITRGFKRLGNGLRVRGLDRHF